MIPTITVDGPIEDQRAINSFIYYIWGSTHPEANRPPGPFGLSNERYIGHVFWDADIWLFPALCLLDPDRAKVIPTYRLRMADAARAQAKAWIESCRRTAYKAVSAPLPATAAKALMYPWESSVSGRETSATKTRFEHHITGDVLWGLTQAEALGLADPDKVRPVAEGCKAFWEARSRKGSDGLFRIEGLISPDENSICDNDLYTNLLAQWTRNGRSFDGPIRYALPHDATGFLTYDKDLLRSYEQATAVLAIYPLQYPPAEAQARAMMDRFESKISQNGPAMSDAIHSIIWARLGDQEKAYDRWRRSWQDFTKGPLMLFSERRNKSVTYFTTGAAGCLQAVLYGFAGFRIDSHPVPKAAWTRRLKGGMWLSVRPCLPQAWRSLTIRNFTVLGHRYTLNVTHERATVSPGD
ncbi:MAG: hypothetical protein HYR64_01145 [Fimbriimonas ginsengisoli]|uniref:Uncharacterized protein n=1 Tax=Fimbriimonas ginsengisoli TaxID=1005039 RepID=A0A931PTQ1_FIMGI|nr:hypothetical protein [Fimbriimonas ginsengisoli]